MDIVKVLTELCSMKGITGFEKPIAERAMELMAPYCDKVYMNDRNTAVGVIYGAKNPGSKKIMLDAHLDRIGFIVESIEDGFLHFTNAGGIDPRLLQGKEVWVHTNSGALRGVICSTPPHLTSKSERDAVTPIDGLLIDIGYSDEKTRSLVKIGDTVTYAAEPAELLNGTFASAAIDDRGGFVTFLHALELLDGRRPNADIYIVGSAQEERSGVGSFAAASKIRPDVAIVVDVDHAETPDAPPLRTHPAGHGAVIAKGPHLNKAVTAELIRVAKEKNIPFDIAVEEGSTGTNVTHIYNSGYGVACGLVSIPLKYMHTPTEVVNVDDIKAVGQVVCEYLLTFMDDEKEGEN